MENQEKNQTNKYDDLDNLAKEADKFLPTDDNSQTDTVIKSLDNNKFYEQQETDTNQPADNKTELPGLVETLKRALAVYKSKFKSLTILALLPLLIGFLMAGVGMLSAVIIPGSAKPIAMVVVVIIFGFLSIVISIMAQVASILVVAGENSWSKALKRAVPKAWPVLVVSLLTALAALGGFALLIVPGVIISVYLIFASFTAVLENKTGLVALSASYNYIKGKWWQVLSRYLFIVLLFLAANFIVSLIPIIGGVASIFLGPILLAYFYLVYSDLKKISSPVPESKNKFILVFIIIGSLVLLVLLVVLIFKLKEVLPDNNLPKINNQLMGWQATKAFMAGLV